MSPSASTPRARAALLALALPLAAASAHACSSCGCTLNADWPAQGLGDGPGWSADLRHDFFVQDELRSGTGSVDRASIPLPADEEVQQKTVNRNTTLTLDRAIGDDFGVSVLLPWISRDHTTIGEGDVEVSGSHSDGIGDIRVIGRWQGLSPERDIGLQLGLKLPTGATDIRFTSGPMTGDPLDRGLQPGTGTTDLLLGGYAFGTLGPSIDAYAQAVVQLPLNEAHGFRPGNGINVTLGARLATSGPVVPHLQLDVRSERSESGPEADAENSGATLAYLSPGVTWHAGTSWSVYAFGQVPVYQDVRGLQLEPRWTTSIGLRARF
jgi:hypothetical protein